MAQTVATSLIGNVKPQTRWKPPQTNWVKCNIASTWNKSSANSGAAWVLRNEKSEVLIHGRRSFSLVHSKLDASMESFLWAVDSVSTLRYTNVIFAGEDSDLIGSVSRPQAWPSFSLLNVKRSLINQPP